MFSQKTCLAIEITLVLVTAVGLPLYVLNFLKGLGHAEREDRSTRARELLAATSGGDARRSDVLMGCTASVDPIVPNSPRFAHVSCSQCGQDFGPGDHGYSHCVNHKGRTPV